MRIYFIITSLESLGGTERVAVNLANDLADHHDIFIISRYCERNAYQLSERVQDIKLYGNTFSFLLKVKKIIKKAKPDIVVVHTMSKLMLSLIIIGMKAKRVWSLEHITYEFHSLIFQFCRKILYKKVDKIITLTNADKLNYVSFHNNVSVIANATPLIIQTSSYNKNSKIVLAIGRLTHQKGFDLLIKAWRKVEELHSDWQLHIYGEGEDEHKLTKLISKYQLSNVDLKGLSDNVTQVYDNAAIFVLSSRFEGFGMVLIEAQSRGLPIISFDCPSGPAEIIHNGYDGYLIENNDIDELANKILLMIEKPDTRMKFSINSLKSITRYSHECISKQWLKIIAEVPCN